MADEAAPPVPPAAPSASPLPLPEEVSDGVLLFSPAVALSSSGLPNGKLLGEPGVPGLGLSEPTLASVTGIDNDSLLLRQR